MTYLELVNKVLKRLRESTVSNIAQSEYSAMVADMASQALTEVVEAWDWRVLRQTSQIATSSGTFAYALPDATEGYNVLQVYEDSKDYDLIKAPSYAEMNRRLLTNDPQTGAPEWWDTNGVDANDYPVVNFWPIPDGVYAVNFNMKVPPTFAAGSDKLIVPSQPVFLRTLQLAVEERGDDGGYDGEKLGRDYAGALADAIVLDANMYEDETTWSVE